jgi:uncharacterized protein YacL
MKDKIIEELKIIRKKLKPKDSKDEETEFYQNEVYDAKSLIDGLIEDLAKKKSLKFD